MDFRNVLNNYSAVSHSDTSSVIECQDVQTIVVFILIQIRGVIARVFRSAIQIVESQFEMCVISVRRFDQYRSRMTVTH